MEPKPAQPAVSVAEETPINVRAYWDVLVKRRWVALATFLAVIGTTAVLTFRQEKVYLASTSLVIDSQLPQVLGEVREAVEVGTGSYWYAKEFYETQYRILRSRAIAQRVIDTLGLADDLDFLGIDELPPKELERKRRDLDPVAIFQKRLKIDPVKDSRIVNVRFEDTDKARATLISGTIAQIYIQANLDLRVEGTRDAALWLQDQVADLKTRLTDSELKLHDFKQSNDLVETTLENKQTIVGQKLASLSEALTRTRTRKAELAARVAQIRAAKTSSDPAATLSLSLIAGNTFVADLKKSDHIASNEVADLFERYGPEHPKMKAALEKQREARERLKREIDSLLAAAQGEYTEILQTEKNLVTLVDEVKAEALEDNKKEIDYRRLARDEETNRRLYDLVVNRVKELDLSGLLRTNNVRILDEAKVAKDPVRPRIAFNLILAALIGGIASIALVFFLEFQDRSIKSHVDIEKLGANFLGLLPAMPEDDPLKPERRDQYVFEKPKSSAAECCRTLRTNLIFLGAERQLKTLLVTSPGPQEGKTTVSINLAITLAAGGQRVLVVDADMRRPRVHKSLGLANETGLSSLIAGTANLDAAVRETPVPGLFAVTSGPIPPNPAELLHTERFSQLLDAMRNRFDVVLFDSPPVGAVTDSSLLAHQLDGTLLVVKAGRTHRDATALSLKSLADANARLLGVVLNDVEIESGHYAGYYVGYYYSKGDPRAA